MRKSGGGFFMLKLFLIGALGMAGLSPSLAAQSSNGMTQVFVHGRFTSGIPNTHAAIFKIPGRLIGLGDSFNGPVELKTGDLAAAQAGWLSVLYRNCEDAVFASDPSQPFVDPQTGLGPCEFVRENFPLDVMTSMTEGREVLSHIKTTFIFDGKPLTKVTEVVKPFETIINAEGETSSCQEEGYDGFLFPVLQEEFDYLDPNGKSPQDTCIGKSWGAPIPADLLTVGTHELLIRLDLESVPETDDFPVEIIVSE